MDAERTLREQLAFAREGTLLGARETMRDMVRRADEAEDEARRTHAYISIATATALEFVTATGVVIVATLVSSRFSPQNFGALVALVLVLRPMHVLATQAVWLSNTYAEVDADAVRLLARPHARRAVNATVDAKRALVVESVTVRHGARVVLDGASLDVAEGEVVAVVGASGSGKSTLLEGAVGARAVDTGHFASFGAPVTLGVDGRALGLAFMPQSPTFFSGTLRANLDPARHCNDTTLCAVLEELDLAKRFHVEGLDTFLADAGSHLSAGERARLALARAFATNASVYVLDEPTASLDARHESVVHDAIRRRAASGAAFLVATHRASTAALAHRTFEIHDGKLIRS